MAIDSNIRHIIKNQGYITISDMMNEVLVNDTASYYRKLQHIGYEGDFITSPEISQLFGEIIGLWVIESWQNLGSPKDFILLELGPGQGTLMRDILKTLKLVPQIIECININLFEVNKHFVNKQKQKLKPYADKVSWLTNLEHIEDKPIIVVSNEFFDALPIDQYLKIKDRWQQQVLTVEPLEGMVKYGKVQITEILQKYLKSEYKRAVDGSVVEESVASEQIVRFLSQHIKKNTGHFLAIDYGYNIDSLSREATQYNPTLQAVKSHKYHPVLESLGEADLTAHVNFFRLMEAAKSEGINDGFVITQNEFLIKYGIELRLQNLQKNKSYALKKVLQNQVDRLINKDQMGDLFKVFIF